MIHVVYQGRALPLAWRVRQGPQGHFPEELHSALVELVSGLIPEGAPVGAALLLTVPEQHGARMIDISPGDGVFAARFPSDDLGLSRFKAATQKSSCFPSLEIVLALRRLSQMGQGLPSDAARRTSAALQHRARRRIAFDQRRLVQLQRSL